MSSSSIMESVLRRHNKAKAEMYVANASHKLSAGKFVQEWKRNKARLVKKREYVEEQIDLVNWAISHATNQVLQERFGPRVTETTRKEINNIFDEIHEDCVNLMKEKQRKLLETQKKETEIEDEIGALVEQAGKCDNLRAAIHLMNNCLTVPVWAHPEF